MVYLSEDEGKTWRWCRALEDRSYTTARLDYPILIQSKGGSIHCTYSHRLPIGADNKNESIKYVHFDEDWVKSGEVLNGTPK